MLFAVVPFMGNCWQVSMDFFSQDRMKGLQKLQEKTAGQRERTRQEVVLCHREVTRLRFGLEEYGRTNRDALLRKDEVAIGSVRNLISELSSRMKQLRQLQQAEAQAQRLYSVIESQRNTAMRAGELVQLTEAAAALGCSDADAAAAAAAYETAQASLVSLEASSDGMDRVVLTADGDDALLRDFLKGLQSMEHAPASAASIPMHASDSESQHLLLKPASLHPGRVRNTSLDNFLGQ